MTDLRIDMRVRNADMPSFQFFLPRPGFKRIINTRQTAVDQRSDR